MGIESLSKLQKGMIFVVMIVGSCLGIMAVYSTTYNPKPGESSNFTSGASEYSMHRPILLNVTVTNTEATHYIIDTPGGLCIIPGIYDTKLIPENRIIPMPIDSGFRIYYWELQDNGNFRLIEMEGPQ